jgi:hypothetical protein
VKRSAFILCQAYLQGDQVGRILAYWAIVNFAVFLKTKEIDIFGCRLKLCIM